MVDYICGYCEKPITEGRVSIEKTEEAKTILHTNCTDAYAFQQSGASIFIFVDFSELERKLEK